MLKPDSPLLNNLKLPLIAAPMFLVSGPELVIGCCKAGVIGTFPALNLRSSDEFEAWLVEIKTALAAAVEAGEQPAVYGVNLIVHHSNPRLQADLALCVKHEVPLIITSLGAVPDVVDAVHSYGGQVFHDVINLRHANKAAGAGVDGLIAVCAGAGGHAGHISPFALVGEIRQFFDGVVILSGCLSSGRDIATSRALGADFSYMGTRFINTVESRADDAYKKMIADSKAVDIVYTDKVSGINANFLKASLEQAGLIDENAEGVTEMDFAGEDEAKAWKDIWSAGQGVGNISDSPPVADLIAELSIEFTQACEQLSRDAATFS